MASACALAMFSGKNIYNFAILENLRIFQNCLFTGGVVEENGICSAAFCESAALGLVSSPSPSLLCKSTLPLLSPTVTSSPGAGEVFPQRERPWHSGTVSGSPAKLAVTPEALPLGELASPVGLD